MMQRALALGGLILLTACGGGDDTAQGAAGDTAMRDTATSGAEVPETQAAAPGMAGGAAGDAPDAVLALGPAYAGADLANGARQFRRCQSCHTLDEGGRHTVGPNLHGIIGAPAASRDGFRYSSQLEAAGLVWDATTLDAWLENPRAVVPGNRMSFVGLRDAEARRDVIAYLAAETAP